MEIKQIQTFVNGGYSNLTSFFMASKFLNILVTFIIDIIESHWKIEHKQFT